MGEHRDIDLLDGDWYLRGAHGPGGDFAWLRDHVPLYWDAGNELWSVARYDDIVDVERRKDTFTSADRTKGGYRPNIPADPALIGMDDPDPPRAAQPRVTPVHPQGDQGVGARDPGQGHPPARCRRDRRRQRRGGLDARRTAPGDDDRQAPRLPRRRLAAAAWTGPSAPSPAAAGPATSPTTPSSPPWTSPRPRPTSTTPSRAAPPTTSCRCGPAPPASRRSSVTP